ncbi:GNAT family N-acetyltransferase [Clostridium ganghwense]|uniref:GNAT family protein n=1 Tax=Clostridium ganghwense TaxID=312089 RepID=A0ABT4CML7_9CLOT|nr:GNAT family protein [Clostridium ganghwense]MCY6369476.1 GNAT family protein [Clostridium ganghwense]
MENVYEVCPTCKNNYITLRQTILDDAEELLKCYSDKKSVPFFNYDNCHGDDFYYTSMERMKQAIEFWNYSYSNRYFVRWTIILNSTNEIIGTIEMFQRISEDDFNHYGVLRIDLKSKYENQKVIDAILEITNESFYYLFDVKSILTKAFPTAKERVISLKKKGYIPLGKKFMIYDDYFVRTIID